MDKNIKTYFKVNYDHDTCWNCVHWLKHEKMHCHETTGYCREIGNLPEFFHDWETTYDRSTCDVHEPKRKFKIRLKYKL